MENRLNYIKNYKEAVDENIEHNNEQSDIVLNRLNNRVVTLANDNNQLKERIRRGEDVGHELNKLDLTIDQIEQEHLDAIKGKLIEKGRKTQKMRNLVKQIDVDNYDEELFDDVETFTKINNGKR